MLHYEHFRQTALGGGKRFPNYFDTQKFNTCLSRVRNLLSWLEPSQFQFVPNLREVYSHFQKVMEGLTTGGNW